MPPATSGGKSTGGGNCQTEIAILYEIPAEASVYVLQRVYLREVNRRRGFSCMLWGVRCLRRAISPPALAAIKISSGAKVWALGRKKRSLCRGPHSWRVWLACGKFGLQPGFHPLGEHKQHLQDHINGRQLLTEWFAGICLWPFSRDLVGELSHGQQTPGLQHLCLFQCFARMALSQV